MIGGGARGMIERGARRPKDAPPPRRRSTGCSPPIIEHYAAHIADRSRPFPQLEATLDRLAAEGYRLAVCTNKLEWLSRAAA